MPTTTLNRSFAYALLLSSIFISLSAGFSSFWTDSEMWAVAATKYFLSHRTEYYFGTKPLFHFGLFLNQKMNLSPEIHPMDSARAFMLLNMAGIVTAVFLILRRLTTSGVYAALACSFLLSLSVIVKRGAEVRSDLIVSHIFLWLLYFQVSGKANLKRFLVGSLFAALVTPKAVLWIVAFLPFKPWEPDLANLKSPRVKNILITSIWIIVGAILIVPSAQRYFVDPLTFFFKSMSESEVGISYFSIQRFQHVFRFLRENPIFVLALGYAFVYWQREKNPTPHSRALARMSYIFLGLLVIYPDRLPFMIAAIVPFVVIGIFSTTHLQRFFGEHSDRSNRARMIAGGLCLLVTIHWARVTIGTHSNSGQRTIAQWMQKQLNGLPSLEIYDPVGIIPKYDANYWFLGPGQAKKNSYVMNYLREKKPELIFYVQKTGFLEPHLRELLMSRYSGDGSGIYVRRMAYPTQFNKIGTKQLCEAMKIEFPRLSGRADITWRVTFEDADIGQKIHQTVTWDYLANHSDLVFPKGVDFAFFQPFELRLPYGTSLGNEFRFDWEF